jgi:tetratricopeptide (TPR) repeat protein
MPVSQLIAACPGATWRQLHALTEPGLLPTMAQLLETGALGTLVATRPNTTVPLWTTIATGEPAHRHGLLHRNLIHADAVGERVVLAGAAQRAKPALWELAAAAGRSVLVVGWPGSHQPGVRLRPADNCTLVSDLFASPALAQRESLLHDAIRPSELVERLRQARMTPEELDAESIGYFVPDWQQVEQQRDWRLAFIAGALAETLSHQAAFTDQLAERDWDLAVVCWPLIEALAPVFTDAAPPYDQVMPRAYALLDQLLAHCLAQAQPRLTWVLSADAAQGPATAKRGKSAGGDLRLVRYRGDGFLVAAGPDLVSDALVPQASVLDLLPTWLAAAGCPLPVDLPGKVIDGLFREPPKPIRADTGTPESADGRIRPASEPEPELSADSRFLRLLHADAPDPSRDPKAVERVANQCEWNRALSLLDAGLDREALPLLEALHERLPEQPLPAQQLAQTRLTLRDLDGAREAAEAALDLAPDAVPALLLSSRIACEGGDYDGALTLLAQAETHGADTVALHRQIAYTQLFLHRWADAVARYDRALALDPEDLGSHLGKARALLALRRFGEARDWSRRALGLEPDRALAHFYLGIALVRLREFESGLASLQAATALAPTSHGAHAWVVRVLKHLKRPSEEISLHLQAMQRIRFLRERRAEEARRLEAARAEEQAMASGATGESSSAQFDEEAFDWSAIDAIPEAPPQPLDLVLISALPGGGVEALARRLRAAGLNLTEPERTITDLGDGLQAFPASEEQIARIQPQLLAQLPRLHHYQVLFVLQPAAQVAAALSAAAADQGLPPGEVARLADRFQRGTVRLLHAMPQIDPLILTAADLDAPAEVLLAQVQAQVGEPRIAARSGGAWP